MQNISGRENAKKRHPLNELARRLLTTLLARRWAVGQSGIVNFQLLIVFYH